MKTAKKHPREFPSIIQMIDWAPVELEPFCDSTTPEQIRNCRETLEMVLQAAAWKHGYLSHRYGDGCGDQGHADSVKEANRTLREVRKALGFTMPDSAAIHV